MLSIHNNDNDDDDGENDKASNDDDCNPTVHNRYNERKKRRRILVTAPTNKAVSVIAKRFLKSHHTASRRRRYVPMVLIGVADKLIEQNNNGSNNNNNNNGNKINTIDTINNDNSASLLFDIDTQLQQIFCYTWLSSLADDYYDFLQVYLRSSSSTKKKNEIPNTARWKNSTSNGRYTTSTATVDRRRKLLRNKARDLHTRLVQNLPYLSYSTGAASLSQKVVDSFCDEKAQEDDAGNNSRNNNVFCVNDNIDELIDNGPNKIDERKSNHAKMIACLRELIAMLRNEPNEIVDNVNGKTVADIKNDTNIIFDGTTVHSELLHTAEIVFCTLSTAGTFLMKYTKRFDDWIVDEASACTEPEILIPFVHLRPRRLLCVGDPMQLVRTKLYFLSLV